MHVNARYHENDVMYRQCFFLAIAGSTQRESPGCREDLVSRQLDSALCIQVPVNNAKQHASCCLDLHVVFFDLLFLAHLPYATFVYKTTEFILPKTSKLAEHPKLNLSATSATTELELAAVQDRDPIVHYVVRLCCALPQSWVTRRLSSSWWKQILS